MGPSYLILRSAPAEATGPAATLASVLLGRAEAILEFADRHPRMAFEAGIEPVALEMRLTVREGGLSRIARGLGRVAHGDLASLDRVSRLQSEASRRLSQYEAEMEGAPAQQLGRTVEVALSAISTLASVAVMLV